MNNPHITFERLNEQRVETLNITVEGYRHKQTGSVHYHLKADNAENVFLVGLKTVPQDSTGAAHILEHTVLCGSKKYPVRDPFFMMIRRSLNTFMNAFTSSDWTAYPFASMNKTDFNNLLEVYLDAVFFPNIDPLDFAQEGHRIELENIEDLNSDLVYKGVVYNEMKGAMSSPMSYAWQKLTSYLYRGTTYHYNSGGEPAVIPSLTYEGLKAFYAKHYHPSNAVFFTFGDIPAAEHQEKFHNEVLQHFSKSKETVEINNVNRYSEPQRIIDFFPAEDEKDKQHVLLGWVLGESADIKSQMEASLLSSALLDNSASPLRYALENSKLADAPSPLCGLEDSNKEMVFICGLNQAQEESEEEIEALILGVLNEVAEKGISSDALEAVLHQMELSQKEITGGSYPYGMQLILDMLPLAVHGGDPITAIDIDGILEELRQSIKNPEYIKQLVKDLLLNNPHRVLLSLKPDHTLSLKEEMAEKERLEQHKAILSQEDKKNIVQLARALKERQQKIDDESVLPKVGIADVPEEMKIVHGRATTAGQLNGKEFIQGTNGLFYEQLVARLPQLTTEELQLLPLYTHCLNELGIGDKSYLEVQSLLDSHTGGIQCYTSLRSNADNVNLFDAYLVLSGKSLTRNHRDLSELMLSFIEQARFDEQERIKDLVSQWRIRRENSVLGNGHGLALMASARGMSPLAQYRHNTKGLAGIQQIQSWDNAFKEDSGMDDLKSHLSTLHKKLWATTEKTFLLVSDEKSMAEILNDRQSSYQALGSNEDASPLTLAVPEIASHQCWLTNTSVNFCAKSYNTVAPYHKDGAALMVLGGFMRNGYLHRVIREQGGAYGGGAGYDSDSGAFRFYSYRDPRLGETLADFDAAIDWVLTNKHSNEALEEAILGVISSIDKPSSPAGEAKSTFHNELCGRTAEKRQAMRRLILQVKLKDLKAVTERYLASKNGVCGVISSESNWEKQGLDGFEIKNL